MIELCVENLTPLHSEADRIEQANHLFDALLLSRLLTFKRFLQPQQQQSNTEFKFDPYLWLLIQVRPHHFRKTTESKRSPTDPFENLFHSLACTAEPLGPIIKSILKELPHELASGLYIAIDEAQILPKILPNRFPSMTEHNSSSRSLFSALIRRWMSYRGLILLVSGTGLGLREAIKYCASVVAKSEAYIEKSHLITCFGFYTNPSHVATYFESLGIPKNCSNLLFRRDIADYLGFPSCIYFSYRLYIL